MSNLETRRLIFINEIATTYRFAVGLAISISLSSLEWLKVFEKGMKTEREIQIWFWKSNSFKCI